MIKNRFSILLGIKQMDRRDIAKITGINRRTLYNIFKGNTKGIEFDTLDKLCYALDCTTDELFRYVPDKK